MGHHHDHNHTHHQNYNKAFLFGIILNVGYIIVELVYGFMANSSALIADAGHNASDVAGLVLAWFAFWLVNRKPKGRYTFGFKKSSILVSVLNAILLLIATSFILVDAVDKFSNPQPVGGTQVMIVAGIGVVINTITALLFIKGQKDDLNLKGAFLHMAADAAVSAGVVLSGLLINLTGVNIIDPIMSLIIVAIIIWSTWQLFIDSVNLALDAAPRNIDVDRIEEKLIAYPEVQRIHDLHVWALSTSENALSVHIVTSTPQGDEFLNKVQHDLIAMFQISHSTIQLETLDGNLHCKAC